MKGGIIIMKIGYVRQGLLNNEQEEALSEIGCDRIDLISVKENEGMSSFLTYISQYNDVTVVIFNEETISKNLNSFKLIQLSDFLKQQNIKLEIINFFLNDEISSETYLAIISNWAYKENAPFSSQIETCEQKKSGRPSISQGTQIMIKKYHERGYSLRQIAIKCQISIGSVHKYISKKE